MLLGREATNQQTVFSPFQLRTMSHPRLSSKAVQLCWACCLMGRERGERGGGGGGGGAGDETASRTDTV